MKKGKTKKSNSKYGEYLLSGEKIIKEYNFKIGLYDILITDRRVLIKRRFPRTVMAFKYKDVEVVEYITKFKWVKLVISVFGFAFTFFFTKARDNMFIKMFGLKELMYLFAIAFAVMGIVYLGKFLLSAIGRLRIIIKSSSEPVEIYTRYTKLIPEFIKLVEGKRRK